MLVHTNYITTVCHLLFRTIVKCLGFWPPLRFRTLLGSNYIDPHTIVRIVILRAGGLTDKDELNGSQHQWDFLPNVLCAVLLCFNSLIQYLFLSSAKSWSSSRKNERWLPWPCQASYWTHCSHLLTFPLYLVFCSYHSHSSSHIPAGMTTALPRLVLLPACPVSLNDSFPHGL